MIINIRHYVNSLVRSVKSIFFLIVYLTINLFAITGLFLVSFIPYWSYGLKSKIAIHCIYNIAEWNNEIKPSHQRSIDNEIGDFPTSLRTYTLTSMF